MQLLRHLQRLYLYVPSAQKSNTKIQQTDNYMSARSHRACWNFQEHLSLTSLHADESQQHHHARPGHSRLKSKL